MDIVKLSTSDIAPYAIDGAFLSALRHDMLAIVADAAAPGTAYSIVEIGFSGGSAKASMISHSLGPIEALTDGSIPFPDKLEIIVGGVTPEGHSFNLSTMLRATEADFVYAAGPRGIVSQGYELILRRFAERALPACPSTASNTIEQIRRPVQPSPMLVASILMLSILMLVVTIVATLAAGWSPVPIPVLGGSIALQIIMLRKDRESTATFPAPSFDGSRAVKIIDLSPPVASDGARLMHQPLQPLDI